MAEPLKNHPRNFTYRFIDDENAPRDSPEKIATLPAVEFYPRMEDYVQLAQINAKRYPLPSFGKLSLQAFFLLNSLGLPAVLLFFDNFLAA